MLSATIKNKYNDLKVFLNRPKILKMVSYLLLFLVALYIFALPSFSGRVGYNYIVYALMIILGVFSVFLAIIYGVDFKNKKLYWFLIFILICIPSTVIFSKNYRGLLTLSLLYLSMVILYFAFTIIKSERKIIAAITIGLLCFSLYFLLHYRNQLLNFSSYSSSSFRLGADFDNENTIAMYMYLGIAANLFAVLFPKKKIEFAYIFSIIIFGLIGLTTGSKKFIICLVVSTIVIPYFKIRRKKWIYSVVVLSVLALAIAALFLPPLSMIRERFAMMFTTLFGVNTGETRIDYSSFQRYLFIRYGFYLASKNLIIGLGYDGFMAYSGIEAYSHSNFVELICDFGIFGCIYYYWMLLSLAKKAKKTGGTFSKLSIVFVIVFFVNSLTYVFFATKETFVILSLILFFADINEDMVESPVMQELYRMVEINI